ncbi:GNAT family N-acetyltransferase [Sphingomonas lenta]|uniref:GNAT family N-acetyltransferase n=2 Tax=Sphingomonas lenta TaxID=1141887 RepID=A0A2A2SDV2_9SPHN|nr:GNAT family N-acetyltransferase [Sphingomonas lenta]
MVEMITDPAFTAQIGAPPATREEVWHRLLRYVAHWPVMGFGHWVVRETASGAYLGEVGLMESRRATSPAFEGTPEAAWGFLPRVHGQGYAAEACAAMLGWADGRGIERTVCIISPGNAPSIRLAERLGYSSAGEVRYRDAPILFFERRR